MSDEGHKYPRAQNKEIPFSEDLRLSQPNYEDCCFSGCDAMSCGRLRLKCDGTRTETTFRLSAKRTTPLKSAKGGGVISVDYW
jgi:hypothetical protein